MSLIFSLKRSDGNKWNSSSMIKEDIVKPIVGKTYSLYGGENSSDNFYKRLSLSAEEVLLLSDRNIKELLYLISELSRSKRRIRKSEKHDPFVSCIMGILRKNLSGYLVNVDEHLNTLTILKKQDRTLSTSGEQYLLYMLEIELTNRIYIKDFSKTDKKIAFLPHCLRDFTNKCMASADEVDHLCMGCSKQCTINLMSRILKNSEITPYIWLKADLKKIFKEFKNSKLNLGVFGIACIPELVSGMRLCRKYDVPVAGIPLDANRCERWMGDFYNNSVNTSLLINLVKGIKS